ncbi:MAG TPA: double-strand break repair helicase AddA [Aestuariivirgaceae bacterium]
MSEMRPLSADGPQRRASNPFISAWVSANAGAGKTQVLVHRVVRLLLEGILPERILCITFTNAAAAEMSKRLFRDLGEWIALDDETLTLKLRRLSGSDIDSAKLSRARRLFASALDAPGGLKIQTIHAFCERLLQRFPVEAGVVPGFGVLSEQTAVEILSASGRLVLTGEVSELDSECLNTVVRYAGAQAFDELLKELLKQPHLVTQFASPGERRAALETAMDLAPGTTPDAVIASAVAGLDRLAYARTADALERLGGSAAKLAQSLQALLVEGVPDRVFSVLKEIYLTKEGDCRKNFPPAALARTDLPLARFLEAEMRRLDTLIDRHRAATLVEASAALLHLGGKIIGNYERAKRALGSYDYDDLIFKSLGLFANPAQRGWVLYKLDAGIDHILIDEAQDTSPEQWKIIESLTEDFFAGAGARGEAVRTIFAVGDEKQSIFGFQGADPRFFRAMRDYFAGRIAAAGSKLEKVPLTVSFRSTKAVLQAVDAVFPEEIHEPWRLGAAGLVEIWPVELGEDIPARDPWLPPLDYAPAEAPRRLLARRIARRIRQWFDDKEILPGRGRPIEPSDILILVRTRTTLMDEIVRALKIENLPVAGADRLELTTHLAVMDLIALGHFALLAEDDQMLACVLKSPLIERDDGENIDDDDLLRLAHGRGKTSLWHRLEQAVRDGLPFSKALGRLSAWRRAASDKPPFEFFSTVLNDHGGLVRIAARLGQEAIEPVGEFLSRCLDHDREYPASLTGFLNWIATQGAFIKRDMDIGAGEIRVMTVHGAKGLESNVVILPDTCGTPELGKHPKIFFPPITIAGREIEVPLWRVKLDRDPLKIEALRDAYQAEQLEEHGRLLYVAMTRAADRLYVCGSSTRELNEDCWYRRIDTALRGRNLGRELPGPDGRSVWRHEHEQQVPPPEAREQQQIEPPGPLPAWAKAPASPEPRSPSWLAPSRAAALDRRQEAERVRSPLTCESNTGLKRGALIHRLLQSLAALPKPLRRERAGIYLALRGHGLAQDEQQEILRTVFGLLDHEIFAPVFAEGSLAEVPIVARVELGPGTSIAIDGRIDRLITGPDQILILDFKSNRPAPDRLESVDPSYIRQLALYRRAMLQLYPGLPVRAGLLWTEGPKLMELPEALMESHLHEASHKNVS